MLSWENDKFLEKCFELSALCFPLWLGTWNFHPALTIPFLMSKFWLWYWLVMAIMVRASARCCPVSTVCVARCASGPSLDMEHRNTCRLLWRWLCAAGALPPVPTRHKYRYSGHCFSLYISTSSINDNWHWTIFSNLESNLVLLNTCKLNAIDNGQSLPHKSWFIHGKSDKHRNFPQQRVKSNY